MKEGTKLVQAISDSLFSLPSTEDRDGPIVKLPPPTTRLPREKPACSFLFASVVLLSCKYACSHVCITCLLNAKKFYTKKAQINCRNHLLLFQASFSLGNFLSLSNPLWWPTNSDHLWQALISQSDPLYLLKNWNFEALFETCIKLFHSIYFIC